MADGWMISSTLKSKLSFIRKISLLNNVSVIVSKLCGKVIVRKVYADDAEIYPNTMSPQKAKQKMDIPPISSITIILDDDRVEVDQEYFQCIEANTTFMVLKGAERWTKLGGCRLKKLKDGACPNCEGMDGRHTYFAKLSIKGQENCEREITLFQADLERLFGHFTVTDTSPITADSLIERMVDQLPVVFTAKVTSNSLYNITET